MSFIKTFINLCTVLKYVFRDYFGKQYIYINDVKIRIYFNLVSTLLQKMRILKNLYMFIKDTNFFYEQEVFLGVGVHHSCLEPNVITFLLLGLLVT